MMSNLGQPITRADGSVKVTGIARYAGDQNQPGQLYAVLVASTVPAGRVSAIDTRAALAIPGVTRVLVDVDMPRVHTDLDKISVPPLATRFIPMQGDNIVHEGQPVAIVVGESLEAAEAAATIVRVTYERAAFIVPETAAVVSADPKKGSYSMSNALEFNKGDAPAAIAAATVKAGAAYTQPSRHANPMEPCAIIAVWKGDRLTVYDAVQHLPAVQNVMAAVFGLPATSVRVVSPHTGGGFGAKAFVWPHEILAAMVAKVVRRPVKLVLTRQQMYGMWDRSHRWCMMCVWALVPTASCWASATPPQTSPASRRIMSSSAQFPAVPSTPATTSLPAIASAAGTLPCQLSCGPLGTVPDPGRSVPPWTNWRARWTWIRSTCV
jgi:xanthine dehydrogenase YagR molybdenum-binding subunit